MTNTERLTHRWIGHDWLSVAACGCTVDASSASETPTLTRCNLHLNAGRLLEALQFVVGRLEIEAREKGEEAGFMLSARLDDFRTLIANTKGDA